MITITVNGEPREVPADGTVSTLLAHLGLDPRMVVVEHNRVIVRRTEQDGAAVRAGDAVEIVHFVGGG